MKAAADQIPLPPRSSTQQALANQAVQQFIDPEDVATLVLFLTGLHGGTISGQQVPLDGDSKSAQ